MRDARQPDKVATPTAPYSPVVVAGDLVFTAGQVAFDATGQLVPGGAREQTSQVLDNLERCLEAVGCTLDDVVKTTVFLTDLEDFPAFNEVYLERFSPPFPARSTVGVRLVGALLVEIEAVARRSQ